MEPIRCERVLLAVGRVPYTTGLGLDTVGIHLDKKGRIPVDDFFRTSAEGVYAIGDVIDRMPGTAEQRDDAAGQRCVVLDDQDAQRSAPA